MIYDCFTFFNELELLELRLHELVSVVDKFVLVEATRTHTNQSKPLHFQENLARFAEFRNKIVHIIVRDLPKVADPWVPDRFQRNCIARGLTDCRPDDWVLVSDLDEIPRAAVIENITREVPFSDSFFTNAVHGALNSKLSQSILQRNGARRLWRKNHPFVWKFRQIEYRYFLNCRSSAVWHGTRLARFRDFSCAEEMRHSGHKIVPDAGWHFSWMGGVDRIRQKIAACAHQEHNQPQFTDPQYIERTVDTGKPLFGQAERLEFVALDDSFPCYLREHPKKFSNWLRPI